LRKVILMVSLFFIVSFGISAYNFPIDNPYSATIIGSSTLMTPGIKEKIPTKYYDVKLKDEKDIPDVFWYAKDFKFSFTKQKNKKAPLIFILAGTGSDYKSVRVKNMEKIFYTAGYHTLSISSPMSAQFLISASKNVAPGLLLNDGEDIYNAMKAAYNKIKNQIDVSEFYIMGYSLGATNSAIVSFIDENEKVFNFKRVFLVNPAVDLYSSAVKLDKYLDDLTDKKSLGIQNLIEGTLVKAKGLMQGENNKLNSDAIYEIVKGDFLSTDEKKAFIGLAFRLSSIDLNFISDIFTKSRVYTKNPESINKFTNLKPYYSEINFANFEDYVKKIGYPFYNKLRDGNFNLEGLKKEANLNIIDEYLRNSDKIVAVTNKDELILSEEDFTYLKNTFKDRIIIYPKGGHCGNMFYKENVDIMVNYIKNGVFKYEN